MTNLLRANLFRLRRDLNFWCCFGTVLALALHSAGCEVKNIHEHDESLESYYMNLVGGAVDD